MAGCKRGLWSSERFVDDRKGPWKVGIGINSYNKGTPEHQGLNLGSWVCLQCSANLQATFPQLSVHPENFQTHKKHMGTLRKPASIQCHPVKQHHSASRGLWAQIPAALGIFLKMHHHSLVLLFLQAPFHSAMKRRQKLPLVLTPHGDFLISVISTRDCGGLSDSKGVYSQLEDEKELWKMRKWRRETCF